MTSSGRARVGTVPTWRLPAASVGIDLAPVAGHGFLHPDLEIPFYLLTRSPLNAWPRLLFVLKASYGGLLPLPALAVANLVCNGAARRLTFPSVMIASLGLTGAAILPEGGIMCGGRMSS